MGPKSMEREIMRVDSTRAQTPVVVNRFRSGVFKVQPWWFHSQRDTGCTCFDWNGSFYVLASFARGGGGRAQPIVQSKKVPFSPNRNVLGDAWGEGTVYRYTSITTAVRKGVLGSGKSRMHNTVPWLQSLPSIYGCPI
jgi:hypothetical protein